MTKAVAAGRQQQSSAELAEGGAGAGGDGGVGWRSGRASGVLEELGRRLAELEQARSATA